MGGLNMFDLEQRIAAWRLTLAAKLGDKTDLLDELESHVREQMHRCALAGTPAEQAWDLALERLGQPELLAREFGKVEPSRPLRWVAAWLVLASYLVMGIVLMGIMLARPAADDGLLAWHVGAVTMGYGAVLAGGALAVWSFLRRLVGQWDETGFARLHWWSRNYCWAGLLLTMIGVVTGAIWAKEHMGQFWAWDPKEIGGGVVIVWCLISLGLLYRSAHVQALGWVLASLGNICVWFAWFGANMLGLGLHAYGMGNLALILLWSVLAIHVAWLALALFLAEPRGKRSYGR